MLLSNNDIKRLQGLRVAVESHEDLETLIQKAKSISLQVDKPRFPLPYLGVLLAVDNRTPEAIEVLNYCQDDLFCKVLLNYLKEYNTFEPRGMAFEDPRPYTIFCQTDFYKAYLEGSQKAVLDFAKRNPPPKGGGCPTILDIGVGNGVLIVSIINKLVSLYNLKNLHLIMVDKFPKMLESAETLCKGKLPIPVRLTSICCSIEKIPKDDLARIRESMPIWFINCALSIHHMPWEEKIPLLKLFKTLSPLCLISDLHSNHDRPLKNSPELVHSVVCSYGYSIGQILNAPISEEDRKICIENFWLVEAIKILKNTREGRVDYHTTIDHWKELGHQAGYAPIQITPTCSSPDRPVTFTIELSVPPCTHS